MSAELPIWMFVAYGGGHIRTLLPVMLRLRESGRATPVLIALTTAKQVAIDAGFEPLGFADFVQPGDDMALQKGRDLIATLPSPPLDVRETVAYLGLSYQDLVTEWGAMKAAEMYAQHGRQIFAPKGAMRRILGQIKPQLVVATNSPRSERAAIDVAHELGVPSVCVVDLFAIDEVAWIGQAGFADCVCVLNDGVRHLLMGAGRSADEVVVTGNPAFDNLSDPHWAKVGAALRSRLLSSGQNTLVLYAPNPEPLTHPFRPLAVGNTELPRRVARQLSRFARDNPQCAVWVRPHPSQMTEPWDCFEGVRLTQPDWALPALLHAVNAVCVVSSTVAVEATLLGKPVLRVLGSMFDDATPFAQLGFADESVGLGDLNEGLSRLLARAQAQPAASVKPSVPVESAAERVLGVLARCAAKDQRPERA